MAFKESIIVPKNLFSKLRTTHAQIIARQMREGRFGRDSLPAPPAATAATESKIDKRKKLLEFFDSDHHYKVVNILNAIESKFPESMFSWDPNSFQLKINNLPYHNSNLKDILNFLLLPETSQFLTVYKPTDREVKDWLEQPELLEKNAIPRGTFEVLSFLIEKLPNKSITALKEYYPFLNFDKLVEIKKLIDPEKKIEQEEKKPISIKKEEETKKEEEKKEKEEDVIVIDDDDEEEEEEEDEIFYDPPSPSLSEKEQRVISLTDTGLRSLTEMLNKPDIRESAKSIIEQLEEEELFKKKRPKRTRKPIHRLGISEEETATVETTTTKKKKKPREKSKQK